MNVLIEDITTNVIVQIDEPISENITVIAEEVVTVVAVEIAEAPYVIEKNIIKPNTRLVFKTGSNVNQNEQEIGDLCMGVVEGQFITANYLGGNQLLLTSYNI